MNEGAGNKKISFMELEWDTTFFGVNCAKAILHSVPDPYEWKEFKNKLNNYDFITIENRNSEPLNAQILGKETTAFLADTNIQFSKKVATVDCFDKNVEVLSSLEENHEILELTHFQYSKFIEDEQLAKRGGDKLYYQWVNNCFGRQDKMFTISRDDNNRVNGYLLHSFSNNVCTIELIAVSEKSFGKGTGRQMFRATEDNAYRNGMKEIKVGTQIRNIGAINFYHKVGCKQVGCHQVFHWWNQDSNYKMQ